MVKLKKVFGSPDAWLFAPGEPKRLAGLRIGLCLLLAIRLSRGVYLELAGQPAALFRPLSFMNIFSSMPSRPVALAAQIVGVSAALLAALGLFARGTLPLAWACGIFLNGMHTSIGKVMHNDVMLLLCLVPLLIAPMDHAWTVLGRARSKSVNTPSRMYGWPIRTATVVVAGAYFFAGLAKLVNSGPEWIFSDNMRWVLYASSDSQPFPNATALFIASHPWLPVLFAAVTLGFELTFPIVLWKPRAAWLYVPAAVMLHSGIWLTMRLDYFGWIATVLVVFVDWPYVVRWLAQLSSRTRTEHQQAPSLLSE